MYFLVFDFIMSLSDKYPAGAHVIYVYKKMGNIVYNIKKEFRETITPALHMLYIFRVNVGAS